MAVRISWALTDEAVAGAGARKELEKLYAKQEQ
jgi:hypothetical protein